MLAGYKTKTNINIGLGFLITLIGLVLLVRQLTNSLASVMMISIGQIIFFYGATCYAKGKGYPWYFGIIALLLYLPGLIILSLLPDRHREPNEMGVVGRFLLMVGVISIIIGPMYYVSRTLMRDREPKKSGKIKLSQSEKDQMNILGDQHANYLKSGAVPLESRKLSIVILGSMGDRAISYLNNVKSYFLIKNPRTSDDEETLRLIDVELKRLETKSTMSTPIGQSAKFEDNVSPSIRLVNVNKEEQVGYIYIDQDGRPGAERMIRISSNHWQMLDSSGKPGLYDKLVAEGEISSDGNLDNLPSDAFSDAKKVWKAGNINAYRSNERISTLQEIE